MIISLNYNFISTTMEPSMVIMKAGAQDSPDGQIIQRNTLRCLLGQPFFRIYINCHHLASTYIHTHTCAGGMDNVQVKFLKLSILPDEKKGRKYI
jgi:hypothetical protein